MNEMKYSIIEDYAYSIEEIQELLDDTQISSTNSFTSISKYSGILLLTTATMVAGNVQNNDAPLKPEINVMVDDNFAIEEYQNTLCGLEGYDQLFLVDTNKRKCIETILSFKALNQSWDGYGAYPLQIQSASNAISVLDELESLNQQFIEPSDIFPNPNGTVSVLWENDFDERVSLEIGNSDMTYYSQFKNCETEFFNSVEVNRDNLELLTRKVKALF